MTTTTSALKERGISFSPAMLAAIREGRKTQTRRIIKPQPAGGWDQRPLPYRPGTRLYVREALERSDHRVTYAFGREIAHRDGAAVAWPWKPKRLGAMYMPKWAARTWLEVEQVMVERVNAIDDFDAEAEGIPYIDNGRGIHQWAACGKWYDYASDAFARLWESIHGNGAWERNDWVWAVKFKVCN